MSRFPNGTYATEEAAAEKVGREKYERGGCRDEEAFVLLSQAFLPPSRSSQSARGSGVGGAGPGLGPGWARRVWAGRVEPWARMRRGGPFRRAVLSAGLREAGAAQCGPRPSARRPRAKSPPHRELQWPTRAASARHRHAADLGAPDDDPPPRAAAAPLLRRHANTTAPLLLPGDDMSGEHAETLYRSQSRQTGPLYFRGGDTHELFVDFKFCNLCCHQRLM